MSPRPQPAPLRVTPLEERRLPAGFYPTFFTTQSVALHSATAMGLEKTNQELSDLREFVRNMRIG